MGSTPTPAKAMKSGWRKPSTFHCLIQKGERIPFYESTYLSEIEIKLAGVLELAPQLRGLRPWAGLPGFEPGTSVLETDVLPLKLQTQCNIFNGFAPQLRGWRPTRYQLRHAPLFRLFVHGVLPAPFAKFFELYFALHFSFIFARPIVDALAYTALEFD